MRSQLAGTDRIEKELMVTLPPGHCGIRLASLALTADYRFLSRHFCSLRT